MHKGDLPIKIFWLHNNNSIGYNDGITVFKNGNKISTMSIESVQENHAGFYTCVAENSAGQTHYSVELYINGNVPIIIRMKTLSESYYINPLKTPLNHTLNKIFY